MASEASDIQRLGRNAPLERLPPEVRQFIMVEATPMGLRSLTRASPVFLRQYLAIRSTLIWRTLRPVLGTTITEAVTLSQTIRTARATSATDNPIRRRMDKYAARSKSAPPIAPPPDLSPKQAVQMLSFHVDVVEPLVSQILLWSFSHLPELSSGVLTNLASATERVRIVRALYRFQLCSLLFGAERQSSKPNPDISMDDLCACILGTFEPWETEEIFCVYEFVKYSYHRIFRRIDWEIEKDQGEVRRKDSHTSQESLSSFGEESDKRWAHLRGIRSTGLDVFLIVNRTAAAGDDRELIRTIDDFMPEKPPAFLDDDSAFADDRQERMRNLSPLPTHEKQNRHEPLPFTSDDGEGPPSAWPIMWGGIYSSRVGGFIPPELRRWGYIFWDANRIEQQGVKEELRLAWEERWDGAQLRDEIKELD